MDLEELNKAQIILLTLLVSFVTSIATGIVTVSLLDQAPPAITQNINRIVERTVERVVPAEGGGNSAAVTETTVVVKESDLITESIDKNAQSLVRIMRAGGAEDGTDKVVGLGVFVSRGGFIATDSSVVSQAGDYRAKTNSGEVYDLTLQSVDPGNPVALVRVRVEETEGIEFPAVTFSQDLGALKLGQTVISLSGGERTNVSIGIVAAIDTAKVGEGEEQTTITKGIRTDIGQDRLLFGSPLVDLFGEVVGLHTFAGQVDPISAGFTPISNVQSELAQFIETQ